MSKVHGVCLAGGTQLASICDVTFVAEDTKVGTPQLPLGAGYVSAFWAWFVGPKKAKEIFFPAGTMITGAEAVEMGLFNRAVPAADLDDDRRRLRGAGRPHAEGHPRPAEAVDQQTQDIAGFRQAMLQGVEVDAIAHASPSVQGSTASSATTACAAALQAFQAGEIP